MARDTMILGEIGSGSEILMEVLEYAENPNYRMQNGPYDENRRGGFTFPRRYGPTQISMEVFMKVTGTYANDELDILFGDWRSKMYTLTQTAGQDTGVFGGFGESRGLTKLWVMDDYFYEVTLENIVERERTMFSVNANVTFIAPRGVKVFTNGTSAPFATGSTFTWIGSVAPDVYIDIVTAIGVPVTINGVTITPTAAGIITLDCTRGKAWRGAVPAQAEVTGFFPSFLSPSTVITLTGVGSAQIYYRKSIL